MELKVAYNQGKDKTWGHQTYGFRVIGLPDADTAALGAHRAMQDDLSQSCWIRVGFSPIKMLIKSGVSVAINEVGEGGVVLDARGYARMDLAQRGARMVVAAACAECECEMAAPETCAESCAVEFGEYSREKAMRDALDLFAKI